MTKSNREQKTDLRRDDDDNDRDMLPTAQEYEDGGPRRPIEYEEDDSGY